MPSSVWSISTYVEVVKSVKSVGSIRLGSGKKRRGLKRIFTVV